jgi:glycine/D-amino acid oxidase-like deaminating enzyme
MQKKEYDVVVVGGGSAGCAAAIAAARNGAKTLLIEQGPIPGGELLSGIPVDGCISSSGEWIVGGIAKELFDGCAIHNWYVGTFSDWKALWVVCIDSEIMKFCHRRYFEKQHKARSLKGHFSRKFAELS